MPSQKKTNNYTLPTKPELEDAYQALWATLQNKLGPYFSDYGQLIEKGSPLNNQYQQLKSNISQHIPSNEDFRSPQRMSEWAQAAALNAPMGLTFVGPKSAVWNKDVAKKAEKMLDKGVPPDEVWKQTLYGRMPDKSMFTEISDSGAKLRFPEDYKQAIIEKKGELNDLSMLIKSLKDSKKIQSDLFPKELNKGITQLLDKKKIINNDITRDYGLEWGATGFNGARLKYALDHGELPNAYPELVNDVVVRLENPNGGLRGSYLDNKLDIYTKNSKEQNFNPTSTALHETQHAIQDVEGWARGGSPSEFAIEANKDPFQQYRSLTGEAQARATQGRMNMDMSARRANYPMAGDKLDDIPLSELINKYNNGNAMSMSEIPSTPFSRAHDIAQKNAALPIEQGGLGLPPNNTAMDRAKAMGFDTKAYHGTSKQRYVESTDIPFFDETKIGDKWGQDERGFSFTNKPDEASYYAASDRDYYNPGEGEGAIYPVLLNKGNTLTKNIKNNDTVNYWDSNHEKIQKEALKKLSDSVLIRDASRGVDMNVIFDPKNIRSRFAAFDPMNKDSANILASILGATTLAGMYGKEQEKPTTLRSVMERKLKK